MLEPFPVGLQIPPLENGDRLSRHEFERRYQSMPDLKKAELIEGVVYMPAARRFRSHDQPHSWIIAWLVTYAAVTPHVSSGDAPTVRLDFDNEPQPDAVLRIIEVMPQNTVWSPGEVEAEAKPGDPQPRLGSVHAAMSVSVSRETIEAVGDREGWLVRWCDRGPFRVIELWIENRFMLELFAADMTADYIHFMQPDVYSAFLAEVAAAINPEPSQEKWVAIP